MSETNDQLTKTQLLGMTIMGLCAWVCVLALLYAIWKDTSDGLIIASVSGGAVYAIYKWLVWVRK